MDRRTNNISKRLFRTEWKNRGNGTITFLPYTYHAPRKNRYVIYTLSALLIISLVLPGISVISASSDTDLMPETGLTVMSVNICFDQDNIDERGPKLTEMLLSYAPDSIGTQENGLQSSSKWTRIFEETLTGYSRVGRGADGSSDAIEAPANFIYYLSDKYECVSWNTISLNGFVRKLNDWHTCTWAVLRNKATGFTYAHVNTHLDYANPDLRHEQMKTVAKVVKMFEMSGIAVFASGDYNTSEGSDTYHLMTDQAGIGDPKFLTANTMYSGSYRGWSHRDLSGGRPIDFIFVSEERMEITEYRIVDTWADGIPLTDHCAVLVRATVGSMRDPYSAAIGLIPVSDISIHDLSVRSYVFEFEFDQPSDTYAVYSYRAELYNSKGELLDIRRIDGRNLDPDRNATLSCTFGCLDPGTPYKVLFYVMNITGAISDPFTITFTTKDPK